MIDALRRRADTHTSSSRLPESDVERASFLGLPRPYGGLFLPATGHDTNAANASSMVHTERGFLNCFFWCGQTGGPEDGKLEEEEDDLAVGMPDVSLFLFSVLLARQSCSYLYLLFFSFSYFPRPSCYTSRFRACTHVWFG